MSVEFGVACKITGRPLPTSDNRRPQSGPHLRYSLQYLTKAIDYLERIDIRMFRLPGNLCPYATHPQHPELAWWRQRRQAKAELAALRERLDDWPLRLSFHPAQFVLLSSPRPKVTKSSVAELLWSAELLDELECGPEARVLIHVGGVYGERERAADRVLRNIARLPEPAQRRLALENDDISWNASQTLQICRQAEVPMIFDLHHHRCLNQGEPWEEMLDQALATWPAKVKPKVHLSSPREPQQTGQAFRAHADGIRTADARPLLHWVRQNRRELDIMLECKHKDVALRNLRQTLRRSRDWPERG